MKKQIILLITAFSLSLGQLSAQSSALNTSAFRYATATLSHQIIDSIVAIGTITVPITQTAVVSKSVNTNSQGNTDLETNYYINSSVVLTPTTKKGYTYDSNGRITASTTAYWKTTAFEDSLSSEMVYATNDIYVEKISKKINGNFVISDSNRVTTTYNANQDPTEKITASSTSGAWVDSLKETNTYDSSFRLLTKEIAAWTGSAWLNTKKTVITYNSDNKTASAVLQDWNGSAWANTTYTLSGFTATVATTVTYSMVDKTATPVIEKTADEVKTYPNPTVDGFYVNAGDATATVSVISMRGTVLLTKQVTGTEYIRVNNIGKGTFLVKITSGEKSVTKKLYVK